MTVPSFSLQSTLALSDSRRSAQILLYFCVFWVVLGFGALVGELGKDPG